MDIVYMQTVHSNSDLTIPVRSKTSIVRRLVLYILIVSSLITLLFSSFQLYREYKRDVAAVYLQFSEIKISFLDSLVRATWVLDHDQINTLIKGINDLPDIVYVEVRNERGKRIASTGIRPKVKTPQIKLDLVYHYRGQAVKIGTLLVMASLNNVQDRLFERAAIILLSNSVKTLLVVTFIYYIFANLVTRHLLAISAFLSRFSLLQLDEKLRLDRFQRRPGREDELDKLVRSINAMRRNLKQHNQDILRAEAIGRLGHWAWDSQTGTVLWSAECYRIFGRDPQTWAPTGGNFTQDMPTRDRIKLEEANRRGFGDGEPFDLTYRYYRGGSRDDVIWIHAFCDFTMDDDGHVLKMIGVVQDVTESVHAEEALRRSQKMEAVGQLTGGIAHDFNNILGIVMGNLEILQQTTAQDAKSAERIEKALKGIQRGADLTKKLLRFSRLDAHETEITNVNTIIEGIESLIAKSLTVSIDVKLCLTKDVWPVIVDVGDFEDAILNLAINARDAMPAGGALRIETANVKRNEQNSQNHPGRAFGEYVLISVSDTGVGMTSRVAAKVFEPFYTTKEEGKGTGLGLSMVYGFVQRSGGFVNFDTQPGKGTTFCIFLPRTTQDFEHDTPVIASSELPNGTETILVVDDEPNLAETAALTLRALGYSVYTATDGDQALAMLSAHQEIKLLFTDAVMPGPKDGYQLALTAAADYPSLRILLTSGFMKMRKIYINSGHPRIDKLTQSLLYKPYGQAELAKAIRQALDEKEPPFALSAPFHS